MSQQGALSFDTTIIPIETLTGNSGGAVGPDGSGNIDILGNNVSGIDVVGTPASNLLTIVGIQASETQQGTVELATAVETGTLISSSLAITPAGLEPILVTPYVVAPGGAYTTIQSAINAANATGGGAVYIRQGSYIENLTLYDQVNLVGVPAISQGVNSGVLIEGTHTPPASGHVLINGICLVSTTSVFSSVAAGTTHLTVSNCESAVQNGFLFNLPNWTGIIEIYDHNPASAAAPWAINDGCINNIGGSQIIIYNSGGGFGTNVMIISGNNSIFGQAVTIGCPVNLVTGANLLSIGSQYNGTVTFSNNSIFFSYNDSFATGSSTALTQSSSGTINLNNVVIDSSSNPVISGAGAGTINLNEVTFSSGKNIAGTLTLAYPGTVETGTAYLQNISFNRGSTTVSTNGQLIIGNTGNNPSISTLTAGTGISISNGAGSITVATDGSTIINTLTGNSGGAISPTAGNINTLGTGSITIAGAGSTLTTELTGLINHNVLIGAGTATITNVAPSATSGVPLISQGAAADPAFGTAVVAGGGTGATTLTGVLTGNGTSAFTASTVTQHGVLVGGASNAISSTSVGTTGQVLQANTAADPTYSTATYPSTTTSQQILYSTANNTVGQLTTANSALAATNSSGTLAMRAFSVVIQTFINSGTYTPTSGMLYCIIECVGGGGGGGGSASSTATFFSSAGSGGAGGYARLRASAATIGASQTVTVGAAGSAGTAGNNAGGNGGDTSVGTLCIGKGGTGGSGSPGNDGGNGGSGGIAGTGDFTFPGEAGQAGIFVSTTAANPVTSKGGNSYFGAGSPSSVTNSTNGTGAAGSLYGGGGGNGLSFNNGGTQAGAAGGKGVVIITEYVIS